MKLIYQPQDRPKFSQLIPFAFQQLLAIMAATIAVPMIIGHGMDTSAALFGAGVGSLVYLLFTQFKSPVFLGSSFAFLGSMGAAFAGAATVELGYLGLLLGAIFAGLVYVVLAIVVKTVGVDWINKLMPAVVIGSTVAIIGLSLAGNAAGDLVKGSVVEPGTSREVSIEEVVETEGVTYTVGIVDGSTKIYASTAEQRLASPHAAMICGLVTLAVTMLCSVYGKKMIRMIPFIIGILAGYAVALIFTLTGQSDLQIINFSGFKALVAGGVGLHTFFTMPGFTFLKAFGGFSGLDGAYIGSIAVAYIPVAFVVFAEHIADHKNISSIIEKDLLKDPGLHRTLLGDGVGSIAGAFFGGCPNTTYGESIGCVAISGNASVVTILCTAILAILISFIAPFSAFLASIPSCVMGGVCIALYGFIAVSGLKMVQKVNLEDNRNLFVVSTILICGIGGLTVTFGRVTITSIATALILGILVNLMLGGGKKAEKASAENSSGRKNSKK